MSLLERAFGSSVLREFLYVAWVNVLLVSLSEACVVVTLWGIVSLFGWSLFFCIKVFCRFVRCVALFAVGLGQSSGQIRPERVGPSDKRIARLGYQSDVVVCLEDLLSRISAFEGKINDRGRELLKSGRTVLKVSHERMENSGHVANRDFSY